MARNANLLSIAAVAERLGTSPQTVRRRIADGTFTAYRIGRLIRLDPSEVDRAISSVPAAYRVVR